MFRSRLAKFSSGLEFPLSIEFLGPIEVCQSVGMAAIRSMGAVVNSGSEDSQMSWYLGGGDRGAVRIFGTCFSSLEVVDRLSRWEILGWRLWLKDWWHRLTKRVRDRKLSFLESCPAMIRWRASGVDLALESGLRMKTNGDRARWTAERLLFSLLVLMNKCKVVGMGWA